jgi:hypothetical protein
MDTVQGLHHGSKDSSSETVFQLFKARVSKSTAFPNDITTANKITTKTTTFLLHNVQCTTTQNVTSENINCWCLSMDCIHRVQMPSLFYTVAKI